MPAEPVIEQPVAAARALTRFQEGFCSSEGEETMRTGKVIAKLLAVELDRRRRAPEPPSPDEADLTRLLSLVFEKAADESEAQRAQLELAQRLAERLPSSVWPQLVLAMSAKRVGHSDAELVALRRARQVLPHDPAIGLAIALATRSAPDLGEAISGLNDYLAAEDSPGFARMRARLEVQRDLQHDFSRRSFRGITLLWPPEVLTFQQASSVLDAIDAVLSEAASLTDTVRRPTLTAVVYPGRSELLAVSCVPTWAGGLFDGVLRLVAANDAASEGSGHGVRRKTLRHETLHAQLTPAVPNAPRWFHEGTAQSFAEEDFEARSQWRLMVRNHVWIPFESLDGSFGVLSGNDAALAYAQSLALVEYLRRRCGSRALGQAIEAFQAGASTNEALAAACHRSEVTGAELINHLAERLDASP